MIRNASRASSFTAVIIIYVVALAAATLTIRVSSGMSPLRSTFLADAAATLVVWLAGVICGNSSVYDPYWSVAPVAIAAYWAYVQGSVSLAGAMVLAAIAVWGIRLTANWALRWGGLAHQDWRYGMYRERMPRLWFAVNLFGIHLMPTVLVYLAMISAYESLKNATAPNLLTAAGFAVCALAIIAEFISDRQMDAYRRRAQPKNPIIAEGLWLVCRHPNYLGEILFWWGIWLMQQSLAPALWTVIGPALVTLLFVFVSIPMMERHVLESRPEYARYILEVPKLLPLGRRHTASVATGKDAR